MLLLPLAALALGKVLALPISRTTAARRLPRLGSHPTESFPAVATTEGVEARWRTYQDGYDSSLRSDDFWRDKVRRA